MKNSNKNPIVFLPGWGFQASVWEEVAQSLTDFNVMTVDLFDNSEPLEIKDLAALLSAKIPLNSIIVAWSISGLFAIYFAHYFPQHCAKLILVSSLPKFSAHENWIGISQKNVSDFKIESDHYFDKTFEKFLSLTQFPVRSSLLKKYVKLNAVDASLNEVSLKYYMNFMFDTDYRDLFGKLPNVHCILSEEDAIIPVQALDQLKIINPKVTLEVLSNASHASFLTHKDLFMPSLLKALYA